MAHTQPSILLASGSPRRRELLGYLGVAFQPYTTDAEDQDITPPPEVAAHFPPADLPARSHPTLLAWRKASAACEIAPHSVIIGADTIVVLDGAVLGKPTSPEHACDMLRRLAGRTHTVYTGMIVFDTERRIHAALEQSQVAITPLDEETIRAYVATGEPMDKAGSYGIQGLGGRLVREVHGSYTNVVGLPLARTHALLAACGLSALVDPAEAYRRWLAAQGKEPMPCPPTFP